MKKGFYIIVALLSLTFFSCQKDDSRVSFTLHAVDQYQGGSKILLSGETPVFLENEAVKINGETYLIDHRNGEPSVYDVVEASEYYAIYPASWVNGNASDKPSITFPDNQVYRVDGEGNQILEYPMVAYAAAGGTSLNFKNAAALVTINIDNDYLNTDFIVKCVSIHSTSTLLYGMGTIDNFTTNPTSPEVRLTQGGYSVSTYFNTPCTLAHDGPKSVSFVIPPINTVGGENITVKVLLTSLDGTTKYTFTNTTSAKKTIGRNQHGNITVTLDEDDNNTKVNSGLFWGGDGTSAENAFLICDVDDLKHLRDVVTHSNNCTNVESENNPGGYNDSKYNTSDVYYKQVASIDLSTETKWGTVNTTNYSIGHVDDGMTRPFKAQYDGDGHSVRLSVENNNL